jgi:hypothetical protein
MELFIWYWFCWSMCLLCPFLHFSRTYLMGTYWVY